jgi:hypothetical protein
MMDTLRCIKYRNQSVKLPVRGLLAIVWRRQKGGQEVSVRPMNEKKTPQEGLTTSLPKPTAIPDEAITLQPLADAELHRKLLREEDAGPTDFAITAAHAQSGKVYPPFIVSAMDEAAARKLCQRNYLVIQSVERYVEQEGKEKPRTFRFGPPISDKDFEIDYGNRPPDAPIATATSPVTGFISIIGILGWLFLGCGWVIIPLGWLWEKSPDDSQRKLD